MHPGLEREGSLHLPLLGVLLEEPPTFLRTAGGVLDIAAYSDRPFLLSLFSHRYFFGVLLEDQRVREASGSQRSIRFQFHVCPSLAFQCPWRGTTCQRACAMRIQETDFALELGLSQDRALLSGDKGKEGRMSWWWHSWQADQCISASYLPLCSDRSTLSHPTGDDLLRVSSH